MKTWLGCALVLAAVGAPVQARAGAKPAAGKLAQAAKPSKAFDKAPTNKALPSKASANRAPAGGAPAVGTPLNKAGLPGAPQQNALAEDGRAATSGELADGPAAAAPTAPDGADGHWLDDGRDEPAAAPKASVVGWLLVALLGAAGGGSGVYWLSKRHPAALARTGHGRIDLLAVRSLGGRQRLCVIETLGERLLIGASEHDITLISHLPGAGAVESAAALGAQDVPGEQVAADDADDMAAEAYAVPRPAAASSVGAAKPATGAVAHSPAAAASVAQPAAVATEQGHAVAAPAAARWGKLTATSGRAAAAFRGVATASTNLFGRGPSASPVSFTAPRQAAGGEHVAASPAAASAVVAGPGAAGQQKPAAAAGGAQAHAPVGAAPCAPALAGQPPAFADMLGRFTLDQQVRHVAARGPSLADPDADLPADGNANELAQAAALEAASLAVGRPPYRLTLAEPHSPAAVAVAAQAVAMPAASADDVGADTAGLAEWRSHHAAVSAASGGGR